MGTYYEFILNIILLQTNAYQKKKDKINQLIIY